jgi:hypothetical protein
VNGLAHIELAGLPLFAKHDLPAGSVGCSGFQDVVPHGNQLSIVVEVIELVAIAPLLLTQKIVQLVVAVQMYLERPAADVCTFQRTVFDGGVACGGE